jgi:uncharacterized protein YndB with AHSA1/START domain
MVLPIREGDIPGIQLRARQRLRTDRAETWRWLTDPRRLERWLADRVEVEPGPRGALRLERATTDGTFVVETGKTERFEPSRAWVLAFRQEDRRWEAASTRLELTVLDAESGCELDVLQAGFHLLSLSACLTIWEEYRRRWRDALARLDEQAG